MRFYYNRQAQRPMKLSKEVTFPSTLDMSEYALCESVKYSQYELFAVSDCAGI